MAQKAAGQQYGKGRPKLNTISYEANDVPETRDQNVRSTIGQIARKAGVSFHVARQEDALQLTKEAAPDVHRVLLENVYKNGAGRPRKNARRRRI
jgi:hypothetical protein